MTDTTTEMRALDPAAWNAAMIAFNGAHAKPGEFFGLSAGIRAYLAALSASQPQGDVAGLVERAFNAPGPFGAGSIGLWMTRDWVDTAEGDKSLFVRKVLRAIIVASGLPHSDGAVAEPVAWRCFHCDEVFTDEHSARLHFGTDERTVPACQIKGSDLGLVEALRRAENDAAEAWHAIHNETTDASKAYYQMVSRHQEQLRAIEEAGYARGLADRQTLGNYLDHMPDRETLKRKIESDPDIGGGL